MSDKVVRNIAFMSPDADSPEQVVVGVVYAPGDVDAHGTAITAREIKRMAYNFMIRGFVARVDVMHDTVESGAFVVESTIIREGDPDFPAGAWVVAVYIPDPVLWGLVLDGTLNGFSIGASAVTSPVDVVVTRISEIELITDENVGGDVPVHSHHVFLVWDVRDRMSPTFTSEDEGHYHEVKLTTATEQAVGHGHRFEVRG